MDAHVLPSVVARRLGRSGGAAAVNLQRQPATWLQDPLPFPDDRAGGVHPIRPAAQRHGRLPVTDTWIESSVLLRSKIGRIRDQRVAGFRSKRSAEVRPHQVDDPGEAESSGVCLGQCYRLAGGIDCDDPGKTTFLREAHCDTPAAGADVCDDTGLHALKQQLDQPFSLGTGYEGSSIDPERQVAETHDPGDIGQGLSPCSPAGRLAELGGLTIRQEVLSKQSNDRTGPADVGPETKRLPARLRYPRTPQQLSTLLE